MDESGATARPSPASYAEGTDNKARNQFSPKNENRPAEFDAKVVAYMPFIRKMCRRFYPEDPEEMTQEVVMAMLNNWTSFRVDGSFVNWIWFTVRSKSQGRRRGVQYKFDKKVKDIDSMLDQTFQRTEPTQHRRLEALEAIRAAVDHKHGETLLRRAMGDTLGDMATERGVSHQRVYQCAKEALQAAAQRVAACG